LLVRPRPRTPLFPYTTLFRSGPGEPADAGSDVDGHARQLVAEQLDLARVEPHTQRNTELRRVEAKVLGATHRRQGILEGNQEPVDRKSTRLNSSRDQISYAVF